MEQAGIRESLERASDALAKDPAKARSTAAPRRAAQWHSAAPRGATPTLVTLLVATACISIPSLAFKILLRCFAKTRG
jgi:hypothetical protein